MLKLKHITPSQAYEAMVSWIRLVGKNKKRFMDHLTGLYREKNANGNSLTNPSYTANSYQSYVLTMLQKID